MRWPGETSLSVRIILLAFVNLVLLAGVAMYAMGARAPRFKATDLLMAAAGDRYHAAARSIAEELNTAPADLRDAIIARAAAEYRVELLLWDNRGRRVAGVERQIPSDVIEAFRALPGPGPGGPGGRGGPGRGGRGPFAVRPPFAEGRGGPRLPGAPPVLVRSAEDARYWIGVRIPIVSVAEIIPGTLFFVSESIWRQPLFQPWRGVMIVVTAMLLTALVWAPFLRGVTRSVRRLESATAQIAEGRFDQVPTVNRHDELGRLAKSIQQMAARLNTLVSGQKRFLGDTAHELRSPLGRMQVALEILERGAPAQDRELIADLRDDVTAMSRLTDDLLEFAHAELAKDGLALEAVSVDEVVRDAVRSERRPGAEISVDVATGLYVMADRRHLKRAIANALRNAIEHAGSAGPVTVTARPADEQIEIAIADSGPGVPDDALDRVFAPFFRLDTSRARQTGGAGLGLAIVRSSIEACRGTVRCSNRRPTGLQVTLTVPAA